MFPKVVILENAVFHIVQ